MWRETSQEAWVRDVIASLVLIVGWLAPMRAIGAADRTHGSLLFETTQHDFGQVYRGQELSQRFSFSNVGEGVLSIQGVHTSCGCTVVEVDKGRKYKPGEIGTVEVRLNTTDFVGPIVKTITLFTNQKLSPDRVLTVKAFVKSEWEVDPPLVDFGQLFSRDGAEQTVRVRPLNGFKLQISGLSFNQDILDAKYTPQGNDYLITIKVKSGIAPGFLKESVVLRSNATYLQEMAIPIRGDVRGNLEFAPNYLEFGVIPKSESAKRKIVLSGISAFDIKSTRLEMIVNGKKIENTSTLTRIESGGGELAQKTVALELKNLGSLEGSVHGKVFVETSDLDQKDIVIDFYAFFR
jgi:hypothetical protein